MKQLIDTLRAFLQRGHLREGITVFVWFFLLLSLFYTGHLYSNDTTTKIESARNLLTSGSFAVSGERGAWGPRGADGATYPHFSIGSILMMVPPVAVWLAVSMITGPHTPVLGALVCGQTMLLTALLGMLFHYIFRWYQLSFRKSLFSVMSIICSTQLLPYSSSGWSEPAALFWSVAAVVLLIRNNHGAAGWIGWGLCAASASLIRIEYAVFFMIFWIVARTLEKQVHWYHFAALLLFLLLQGAHPLFNVIRFGTITEFGYIGADNNPGYAAGGVGALIHKAINFFSDPDAGKHAFWFFLSFGKNHWFWSSPLLFLSPLAFFHRKNVPALLWYLFLSAAIVSPLYIYFINTGAWCCTDWCWGYRYFVVIFPFLLLPLAFIVFRKTWMFTLALSLAVVGCIIAVIVSLTNYHLVLERLVARFGENDVMWGRTAHFLQAPFWEHCRVFGEQLPATVALVKNGSTAGWEVLRAMCLDVWPTGLTAVGVPSQLAFGAWGVLFIVFTLYTRAVMKGRHE